MFAKPGPTTSPGAVLNLDLADWIPKWSDTPLVHLKARWTIDVAQASQWLSTAMYNCQSRKSDVSRLEAITSYRPEILGSR